MVVSRTVQLAGLMLGAALMLILAAGCADPLFPRDEPRTPYERYQVLRGQERELNSLSSPQMGHKPALRERMRPLEQW